MVEQTIPWWGSGTLDYQKAMLKLASKDRLTYVPDEGYRTAKKHSAFK